LGNALHSTNFPISLLHEGGGRKKEKGKKKEGKKKRDRAEERKVKEAIHQTRPHYF